MSNHSQQIPWEAVAKAHLHPLRLSILELLTVDGGRPLSPNEMAFELQEPLSSVAYHVGQLRTKGLLKVVREEQRRGAVEHYHEIVEAV